MKNNISFDKLVMGVCYYPEHWDENLWHDDLKRMKKAGISVIRIAEFAWNFFEPKEGTFTFEFFDNFMKVAVEEDIKVIFCTPTATPPAWASHNYPEILNRTMDGVLICHGERRHYNYNSPKYIELCKIITTKLAEHYGSHPSIIGWQLDNELNCQVSEFYSDSDNVAFREFLKEKYTTLEALNKAWGTVFWNQTYTSFEEIFVPRHTTDNATNPHHVLDYNRFISNSAINFASIQSKILRKFISKDVFITTNGLFARLDNHQMTDNCLDFMSFDSYPNFAYCYTADEDAILKDRYWSSILGEVRSISNLFGVMEQQTGANGWTTSMLAPMPRPGQIPLWTMQSIAHGANFISYFRWRTATMGTEIYWHGILDYWNKDNRRLAEVTQMSKVMNDINEVASAEYQAEIAYIKDYDNLWDSYLDIWHKGVDNTSYNGWITASQFSHTPMDYLYLQADTTLDNLKKYKVLVYPHATILTEERAKLIKAYVEQGGKLIIGCRTGYKDITGKCVMSEMPGHFSDIAGATVEEFVMVKYFVWGDDIIPTEKIAHEILNVTDGEVLGKYKGRYYHDEIALVKKQFGQGEVYYFGGTFTAEIAETFIKKLGVNAPYSDIITLEKDCEIAVRQSENAKYIFVLNYKNEDSSYTLHKPLYNLITKETQQGEQTLEKYKFAVYKL